MQCPTRAALCLLVLCALASCAAPQPLRETSPVRIGLFADLSSTGAREGNDALKGAELRVAEANESGGIGGRPIELLVRDMKQSAPEAIKAFTQLAQEEGVCAVIGSAIATSGLTVSPVADLSKVPLISLSVDDRVTNPDLNPENPEPVGPVRRYAFFVQPSATQSAAAFARYAAEHFMLKRYATLYDAASPVSVLQARAFENALGNAGRTVAASVVLPEGDLAVPLRALREAAVDGVYVCASTEKDAAAAKAIREALPQAVLLGNQSWYAPRADQPGRVGSAFAGVGSNAWFWTAVSPDDPALTLIAPSFAARFGEKPRPAMVPGWDAAGLVIAAVRRAGTSSPSKVRDALEVLTGVPALQGEFTMDRKTHRPASPPVAIMRIVGDSYVTAEPRYVSRPTKAP
jgi:branched-chain amino acid transport system substrate-binding protein